MQCRYLYRKNLNAGQNRGEFRSACFEDETKFACMAYNYFRRTGTRQWKSMKVIRKQNGIEKQVIEYGRRIQRTAV